VSEESEEDKVWIVYTMMRQLDGPGHDQFGVNINKVFKNESEARKLALDLSKKTVEVVRTPEGDIQCHAERVVIDAVLE
jgi:hypothetical protein